MVQRQTKTASRRQGRPLILVTNDDGVYAEGIRALAKRLKQAGQVVVVAPNQERSATSHSLTLHRPLRIEKLSKDVYAVDGTPTDCVNIAIHAILDRRPDVIVSGVNRGGNLGDDVHYSGTVSAAMEGCLQGIPSIAMSVVARENFKYQAACSFAVRLVRVVLEKGLPKGIMLNVNVPNLPRNKVKGYHFSTLGKRDYGELIAEKRDPRGRKYYWFGGDDAGFDDLPGSDCNSISRDMVSITPVNADLADHLFLKTMKSWVI